MTDKPISIGRHQSQINRVCRRHGTLAACRRLDNLARILSRWSAAPSCCWWWWWWWCCGGNAAGDTSEMQSRMWRGWSGLSESAAVGRSQLVASRDEKRADAANLSSHPRPIISSSATTQSTAAAVVRLRPTGRPAGFHGAGVARSLEGRGGRGVGERSSPRRPAETGDGGGSGVVVAWRRGDGGGDGVVVVVWQSGRRLDC